MTMSSVRDITDRYEQWMRACVPYVEEKHLKAKHNQMAKTAEDSAFRFFRGTFYLWSVRFPQLLPELVAVTVPTVIGVGDIHVENFGTWRDAEGRLVWGVNDIDEATLMPCTQDLVRLMSSAALAGMQIGTRDIVEQVMVGYRSQLAGGARPFVLAYADDQPWQEQLWRLARARTKSPVEWWQKIDSKLEASAHGPGPAVMGYVSNSFPGGPVTGLSWRTRQAGMGSLGRPRVVATGSWFGGRICREAKATTPSAWDWAMGSIAAGAPAGQLLTGSYRPPDPYSAVVDGWSIKRLAPDSDKIDIEALEAADDKRDLLRCMGSELANIHLGTADADTLANFFVVMDNRLVEATKTMAKAVEEDQREYADSA